jgi:signal transduction histidine kinase/CheY-like chemotaxis protein
MVKPHTGSPSTFYWQLAIFLAGFLLVVGLSHLYLRLADELGLRTARERARLFIGEEIVDSIQEIEKGVYQMVATGGIPAQQRAARAILTKIAKLEHDIGVLQKGGMVKRVSPLNMEGRDEVVRTISYQPDTGGGYLMEVIELSPYLDIMRATVSQLGSMLERRENIRNHHDTAALLTHEKEISLFLKTVPPLFFRLNENANRMFLESSTTLQNLEAQLAVERKRYRLFANLASFLVILSVMASGLLFFRQVATSGLALSSALDHMRAARDEAEQASRAKSQFLANMSHEIRTPMNAVLGLAELLLRTDLNEKQRHYTETIFNSGSSLLSLLNDILDLSRIEAGKLVLEQTDFDLRQTVQAIAHLFREAACAKGISLNLEVAENTPHAVRGDQLRLRQTLVNLVGNAIKFTHRGEVAMEVALLPGTAAQDKNRLPVRFAVRDTGIGIDPEKCSLIFKTFTQADDSTTRKYGGTGLGLSVSRQLIEMMGGTLEVTSTPGEGALFFFTIPFTAPESPEMLKQSLGHASVKESAGEDMSSVTGKQRVLVAEDNSVNLAIATEMLEILGYDVDTATDGAEALTAAFKHTYDMILMDCQMPKLDGFDATRRIRTAERERGLGKTPIVALTGNAMQGDREACLEAGMDDYLSKPFSMPQLAALCEKWLGSSRDSTGREST